MSVSRLALHHQGPTFSRLIMGYWRLMEWQLSPAALLDLMKYHLDLGVTTIDHADIYGGYQCEEAFGQALRLAPIGMIGGFIGGFAEISYLSLLPNVALASGGSDAEALSLLTMLAIGGGVLQLPIGWLADKFDKTAISLLLAAAFVLA